MPVSATDGYVIATFTTHNIYLTVLLLAIVDGLTGVLAYKLSYILIPKFAKKQKHKEQLINIGKKLGKWGWWVVFIAAATPFPYTLTIYAAGVVNWGNNKKIYSSVFLGKLARYAVIAVVTYFGYKIDYSNLFKNYMNEIIVGASFLAFTVLERVLFKYHFKISKLI